jgi:hypothetical protein
LRALREAWAEGAALVAVHGPPGAGKTSIARAFAAELGGVSGLDLGRGAMAPIPSGWVLLDDVDLLAGPAAAAIAPRLGRDLRVIWTSSAPPPLSQAVSVPAPPWTEHQARALAWERGEDEPLLRELLDRVIDGSGGNPLAVELALARLRLLPAGRLIERLRTDPVDTLGDPGRRPARHRRWRTAVAWTRAALERAHAPLASGSGPWSAAWLRAAWGQDPG